MDTSSRQPADRNGVLVRVLAFSGDWYEKLPADERERVDSIVGEVLVVEEIDAYAQPWVCKRWLTKPRVHVSLILLPLSQARCSASTWANDERAECASEPASLRTRNPIEDYQIAVA
jgi:hypothetical protein